MTHELFTRETHSLGDFITAVMAIEDEAAMRSFFEDYTGWLRDSEIIDWQTVARSNIGWCFGEGMAPERIALWVKVTGASHPIFGTSMPSGEDALAAGIRLGEEMKREAQS